MRQIKPNTIVRHFKGNYYIVIGISHSTDNPKDLCVVYQSLDSTDYIWSRPLEEFMSLIPEKSLKENVTGQEYRFEVITNLNRPLTEASTESLIKELRSRKDLYDYNFYGEKCSRYSEYVYGTELPYSDEENPLAMNIRGYTDDVSMLKKCLRIGDIVYQRIYVPVDVADLPKTEE